MRFYEVEAKCGHVGLTNCVWIKFAVKAKTSKEAADAVKRYGRVKRNHKDFIRGVSEISYDEYRILARENKYDPYLNARNIREQRAIPDFDERVEVDEYNVNRREKKKNHDPSFKLKKIEWLVNSAKRRIDEYAEFAC